MAAVSNTPIREVRRLDSGHGHGILRLQSSAAPDTSLQTQDQGIMVRTDTS